MAVAGWWPGRAFERRDLVARRIEAEHDPGITQLDGPRGRCGGEGFRD
jgi:hypothetical protein